ncbi:hypothetical protein EDD37DRAFT_642403 [Exophiala viscosa]|uniref:uncharacterized protein n=1 Tax=Exophiala viscosa TaxID=2486360 RepID=UPI0021A093B3|nr:hypothetical protein EDD37DRAFT_642403 [Exophiala viscosa]
MGSISYANDTASAQYPQETYLSVKLAPGTLVEKKRRASSAVSLKRQLGFLKSTGRYDAFKLKWHPSYDEPPTVWPIGTWLFWDSDIGKWIEGACYFLQTDYDAEVDQAVQELTEMIASAQHEDGYLNINYSVVEPLSRRFTNFRDMCEDYNAGHLLEGALAHQHYYKNDKLLAPMLRYMELLMKVLGPKEGQLHGYPGHPELELALVRLYERTKDTRYFEFAKYFVTERGNPKGADGRHFYDWEAERRGDDPHRRPYYYPEYNPSNWYYSASVPLTEMKAVEGHSVRPTYLLTAVADIVRLEKSSKGALHEAIERLWNDMVSNKMYVTGGIGSIAQWEGFGIPYFLPQGTDEGGCYAETCAGIGIMMMVQRVLQYELDGKYTDIMELAFYNAVLTAMSVDGKKYTYVNQLASSDTNPADRSEWFKCCCCPPNIMRTLAIIGGYIYSQPTISEKTDTHVAVHLYIPSTLDFEAEGEKSQLTQESNWPWDGDIKFRLSSASKNVSVSLRIPKWAEGWSVDPEPPHSQVEKGYLTLPTPWLVEHPEFTLQIPMKPRVVAVHPFTTQDTISLARGPIIYCVEDYDNPWVEDHFKSLQLDPDANVEEKLVTDPTTEEEYVALSVHRGSSLLPKLNAEPSIPWKDLAKASAEGSVVEDLHFVPYYFHSNRGGRGHVRTGIRRWIR